MVISQLINTLNSIMKEYGNINVETYFDSRQNELFNEDQDIFINEISVVKIKPDGKGVYLSNEFIKYYNYKDCNCTVRYNPEDKRYYGTINTGQNIEGFDTEFSTENKFQIEDIFHYAVEQYLSLLAYAQLKRTLDAIDNTKDEYPPSDDDYKYN